MRAKRGTTLHYTNTTSHYARRRRTFVQSRRAPRRPGSVHTHRRSIIHIHWSVSFLSGLLTASAGLPHRAAGPAGVGRVVPPARHRLVVVVVVLPHLLIRCLHHPLVRPHRGAAHPAPLPIARPARRNVRRKQGRNA
eukprot:5080945-Pyramimonas_sp.AAC.1